MLQRDPFEGARRSVDEIYNRNRALFFLVETVVLHVTSNVGGCPHRIAAAVFGGGCGHGGGGGVEFYFHKLRFGCATEPVCHVSEARGADRVQVQVRSDVLRGPQVPGGARVRVRFQDSGKRGDCTCQPRDQSGEAAEDLMIRSRPFDGTGFGDLISTVHVYCER